MNNQLLDDDDTAYQQLINDKGKRARRRELEAVHYPDRLRRWLAAHDLYLYDVSTRETGLFVQFMRAYRHSCHSACCAIDGYVKRHERRQQRHATRQELRRMR